MTCIRIGHEPHKRAAPRGSTGDGDGDGDGLAPAHKRALHGLINAEWVRALSPLASRTWLPVADLHTTKAHASPRPCTVIRAMMLRCLSYSSIHATFF